MERETLNMEDGIQFEAALMNFSHQDCVSKSIVPDARVFISLVFYVTFFLFNRKVDVKKLT